MRTWKSGKKKKVNWEVPLCQEELRKHIYTTGGAGREKLIEKAGPHRAGAHRVVSNPSSSGAKAATILKKKERGQVQGGKRK